MSCGASTAVRSRSCASTNRPATRRTLDRPRTGMRNRPRLRACGLTHSAVAARAACRCPWPLRWPCALANGPPHQSHRARAGACLAAPPRSARARESRHRPATPGAAAQAWLDLPEHRCQLGHVAAGVDHLHADDDLILAGGGKLLVEGRAKTAIAHLHDPGLRIGGARPGVLGLAAVALLGRRHFGQLLQCRLDALLPLLGSAQPGLSAPLEY